MRNQQKKKEELISEVAELRQRIAELEAAGAERNQAEEALRQAKKFSDSLIAAMKDGFSVLDSHGVHIDVNPAFCQMTGFSREELIGVGPPHPYWPPEAYEEIEKAFQKTLRGEFGGLELTFLRKNGERFPVIVSPSWVKDKQGNVISYFATVKDITERRQAEKLLRQSEARYRAVVEQSADGIYLVDVEARRVMEANRAFAQILGYALEEVPGIHLYDFIAAKPEDIDQRYEKTLRGEGPLHFERKYRRKDGSLVEVWLSSKVISYGGREVVCTLVRDLTERKALEAQLLRAQRMETIGLLAGGIAHDLNNILSPILMNVELLQRDMAPPSQERLLSSISASAQRGADIVKQILTFSRGMEGERALLFPSPLLKEIEHFLQETFPKTIQIRTELPKDLYPLWGDATQLHQVLMNLCLNAKDAMEKGGKLLLSAGNLTLDETYAKMYPEAQVGPYLLFTVSDTGSGIPPEDLSKIFDPFFTTKERGKGTGLGLATVLALVKGHGGFLSVDSEVGKGTAFRIYLPASPAAEGEQAVAEREPLPLGSGELILVAEDEESIRDILKTTLETYGYSVLSASDGAEAVSLYAQQKDKISLVITDMAMPIMDGPSTIRALHRMNPSLQIIAMSGAEWEEKAAEGMGLKIEAFLSKPFTSDRLLRRVAEVLTEKKA